MPAQLPLRSWLALVGAAVIVIATANPAAALPGDLDTTFDGDGKVTTDLSSGGPFKTQPTPTLL
jgi:hypothetical protein